MQIDLYNNDYWDASYELTRQLEKKPSITCFVIDRGLSSPGSVELSNTT